VKFFELQIHIKYFAIHGKAFQIYECSYCAPSFFCSILWFIFFEIDLILTLLKTEFCQEHFQVCKVFFSPFIHADMEHLYNNSVPTYFISCIAIFLPRSNREGYLILFSGLITWIIGRSNTTWSKWINLCVSLFFLKAYKLNTIDL
jgi:membrane associated rhomboid family serine protease